MGIDGAIRKAGLREKPGACLSTMTEETNVDVLGTAAAVGCVHEDDRAESGLLDK